VTVRVTDVGGLTYDETFTINLTNVNETPTDLSLSANTVAENAANGTVVGTVSGTDPDSGDTKTYSLTDTAGGRFSINASTGVITVADGSLLDYENAASHSLTVRVTDSDGLTYDGTFTINLTNVNEGPTNLALSANSVAENAVAGTVVGTVSGTDPDSSDSFTYQLTDTAGGRFSINASTGVITVADGSLLDYENAASHSLTVRVTDSGGLSYDKTFTISLSNEGEAPTSSQDGRGVGPSLIASLPHSVRGLPESSRISASSASDGQDTRTNDPYWSDDSKNSVKVGSLPGPKMDMLGSDANHHDLGSEDGMHQTGTSNMAENFLNSSSRRDGTTVSRDSADAQRVACLESGQVPRPHTEKAENVSSVGSNGLSMPMLAGLVEVALQGGLGTEDNLGTANTQIRKRNQAASAEKKAQPQPGDEREAPPSAA
jgi:VCBS repeat-containing protein